MNLKKDIAYPENLLFFAFGRITQTTSKKSGAQLASGACKTSVLLLCYGMLMFPMLGVAALSLRRCGAGLPGL